MYGYALSSLDSSTLLVEVTSDYAAHFYDMYVEGHTGKHLTGDRVIRGQTDVNLGKPV